MRPSKYRHVYGQPNKKEICIDNTRLNSKSAFDSNLAKANSKFVSLNWASSGGGLFAVLPTSELGKLGDKIPLFVGHRGTINDTAWNPFNDYQVATSSDDGTIGIWDVPKDFTTKVPEDAELDDIKNIEPVKYLKGHGKKVGHIEFSPAVRNVLASSGFDYAVRVWNIESGEELAKLPHKDMVTGFSFSADGSRIATVSRDKKIRVWDVRSSKLLQEGTSHQGAKASRVVWLGNEDRLATTGFSKFSERQIGLWDASNLEKGPIGGFFKIDQESGVMMPFYDPGTHILYLAGRGDTRIVYYEFANDDLLDLFSFSSTSPQRGLAMAPQSGLDIKQHEIAHFYKIHETMVEPIKFLIPRKGDDFLEDVYKSYRAPVPALEVEDWLKGETKDAILWSWEDTYYERDQEEVAAPAPAPKSEAKAETAKTETKETPKEEPKAATPKAATPAVAKETPKETPKETSKASTSTPAPKKDESPVPAQLKAEKQDAYEVFQSKDVKTFLDKSADKEEDESENDEKSSWDDEPKEVKKAEPKEVKKEVKAEPKTEPKKEVKVEPKVEPKKETKVEPKEETKVESQKETKDESLSSELIDAQKSVAQAQESVRKATASVERAEQTPPATPKGTEPATPKGGPLGKLADLNSTVQDLKNIVAKLVERVEALEAKN